MNQKLAESISKAAYKLYREGKYSEAERKYKQALALSDPNYWGNTDYHSGYAMVLKELGKTADATKQLELALESAIKADDEKSVTVTVARHALAEHFIKGYIGHPPFKDLQTEFHTLVNV